MNKMFEEAMPFVENKTMASKEMSAVSRVVKSITHYDSEDITAYKDMIHYKGLGWVDNNPIGAPNPAVRFKDRVSPCFRRLSEIIRILKEFGDLELINEYREALSKQGIEIVIHDVPDNSLVQNSVKDLMKRMDNLQGVICQNANNLRDMGEDAEKENLCPKTKFKELAESYYKAKHAKDVREGLHKTMAENLLHNNGISEVLVENTNTAGSGLFEDE